MRQLVLFSLCCCWLVWCCKLCWCCFVRLVHVSFVFIYWSGVKQCTQDSCHGKNSEVQEENVCNPSTPSCTPAPQEKQLSSEAHQKYARQWVVARVLVGHKPVTSRVSLGKNSCAGKSTLCKQDLLAPEKGNKNAKPSPMTRTSTPYTSTHCPTLPWCRRPDLSQAVLILHVRSTCVPPRAPNGWKSLSFPSAFGEQSITHVLWSAHTTGEVCLQVAKVYWRKPVSVSL